MNYLIYRLSDGVILALGSCQELSQVSGMADVNTAVVVGTGIEDASLQYMVAGVLTPRPPCPVTASVSGRVITFSGLPVGSTGNITGDATMTINNTDPSGTNVLTFPHAGTYSITVDCFPALDYAGAFTLP